MSLLNESEVRARLAQETVRMYEDPAARSDPHPLYDDLREHAPVYACPVGPYLVTGFEDVRELLKDDDRWRRVAPASGSGSEYFAEGTDIVHELFDAMMLWRDGEPHQRLRRLFNRPLTPRNLAELRPRIDARADALADELASRGEMEVIVDYASPLTMGTMCDLTGFDPADSEQLTEWSHAALAVIEGSMVGGVEQEAAERAFVEAREYLVPRVEARRSAPAEDILTCIAEGWDNGRLSEIEAIGMALFLIIGGHDTTWKTIANGIYALVQHPDQYQLLRDDPSLLASATEEILRYDSSARNALPRWAKEDVTLGGVGCPVGAKAVGMLNAANRDASVFEDPHRFDIRRPSKGHLAFGFGAHFCSGASLARMMISAALSSMTSRIPQPELVETPERGQSWNARELQALRLRWDVR